MTSLHRVQDSDSSCDHDAPARDKFWGRETRSLQRYVREPHHIGKCRIGKYWEKVISKKWNGFGKYWKILENK